MDTGLNSEVRIRIRLHGHLWRYPGKAETWVELPWQQGKTLAQILEKLRVPGEQVMLALANGKPFPLSGCPQKGDIIELLPVIDGG